MTVPLLYVDFNERVEHDLVLLCASDTKADPLGRLVTLHEGMPIRVYSDDADIDGTVDNLVATGKVERNPGTTAWAAHVKWCCRIDAHGIRHESKR